MEEHARNGTRRLHGRDERLPVPDPADEPNAYKDPEVLENLYVTRGWSRRDITDHFDIKDHEVVEQLEKHDIQRDVEYSKQPTNGLAAKLFEIGKAEAVK